LAKHFQNLNPTNLINLLEILLLSSLGIPLAINPNSILSLTVIQGKTASSWNTKPLSGAGPVTSLPSQKTLP